MYIALAWITLHVIKVGSNWNSNLPSFSAYILSRIMHNTNFLTLLWIWNLEQRNDNIYVTITRKLFHSSFTLENDNTILCWIYSTSTLSVGKTGDSYKDIKRVCICFTQVYVYGIPYFPFHSVFHSFPFSVPRFSNTPNTWLRNFIFWTTAF